MLSPFDLGSAQKASVLPPSRLLPSLNTCADEGTGGEGTFVLFMSLQVIAICIFLGGCAGVCT